MISQEEAAVDYTKRGFVVIPLKGRYASDKDEAKRPIIKWEKWIAGTRPDEKTVREWFVKKPNADIALLTGPTNGLLVVDVDGEKGKASIDNDHLLPTPLVHATPRGQHFLFRWDNRLNTVSTTLVGILPGVDIRGKGGYIVAPPSYGLSDDTQYFILAGGNIPMAMLPLPPEWLVQLLLEKEAKRYTTEVKKMELSWFQEIYPGVAKGENRHKAMTKLASYYYSLGLPEADVVLLMGEWNERCTPPRPEAEFSHDLNRFLNNWRNGKYKTEANEDIPTEFKTTKLSDFMGEEEVKINWLVDKLIPTESITFLNGYSGLGKSWLTLSLAIAMGRGGGKWINKTVSSGRVLYIDQESHKALLKHRFNKLLLGQQLTKSDVDVHMLSTNDLKLDKPSSVDAFKGLLVELQPKLVILDPFISLHSGNENSTEDMGKLRSVFKSIIQDCACGLMIIDHESKPGDVTKSAAQRQRGSSEKGAVADVTLSLIKQGDSIMIEHAKARYGQAMPSMEIKITDTDEKSTVVEALEDTEEVNQV